MKTPKLDDYIFKSFFRLKNIPMKKIRFNIRSASEINKSFILSLFDGLDVTLTESRVSKKQYDYSLLFKHDASVDGEEYALLLGKITMLCSNLYAELISAGMDS